MNNIKIIVLLDKRKLPLKEAQAIADSQTDLGGKSKTDMVIALNGLKNTGDYENWIQKRLDAYLRLDNLSQLIVYTFLEHDSIIEAKDNLNYIIDNIKNVTKIL